MSKMITEDQAESHVFIKEDGAMYNKWNFEDNDKTFVIDFLKEAVGIVVLFGLFWAIMIISAAFV